MEFTSKPLSAEARIFVEALDKAEKEFIAARGGNLPDIVEMLAIYARNVGTIVGYTGSVNPLLVPQLMQVVEANIMQAVQAGITGGAGGTSEPGPRVH
jgi:hypothetical protein